MYRTRQCAVLALCDIYTVLLHSDFISKCRLLLQDEIQLILPSLLLPCRDTNRSSHWHVVSWLHALLWLTHGPKMLILAQRK